MIRPIVTYRYVIRTLKVVEIQKTASIEEKDSKQNNRIY